MARISGSITCVHTLAGNVPAKLNSTNFAPGTQLRRNMSNYLTAYTGGVEMHVLPYTVFLVLYF